MSKRKGTLAVCPLASGSKGNAYWIEGSETTILVDAGLSFRQLSLRVEDIGRNIEQVEHIYITHEHNDHVQALAPLLRKYKPVVWASRGTLRGLCGMIPDGTPVRMIDSKEETAGSFRVRAFPVSHDAAEPMGFRFDSEEGSLAIVTDLGQWDPLTAEAVREVDLLACEANHDPNMLQTGPYPPFLKQRVASIRGHLSNEDGALLALEAVRNGARYIILSHLSQQNNEPELARKVFTELFQQEKLEPEIEIASQFQPGPWVEIIK